MKRVNAPGLTFHSIHWGRCRKMALARSERCHSGGAYRQQTRRSERKAARARRGRAGGRGRSGTRTSGTEGRPRAGRNSREGADRYRIGSEPREAEVLIFYDRGV